MNSSHNKLIESSLLWLPIHLIEDDTTEAITENTKSNGIILDFLDGEIGLEETIDHLNDCHIDIDNYLRTLDSNLRSLGA